MYNDPKRVIPKSLIPLRPPTSLCPDKPIIGYPKEFSKIAVKRGKLYDFFTLDG
jgi:hypothetical protein